MTFRSTIAGLALVAVLATSVQAQAQEQTGTETQARSPEAARVGAVVTAYKDAIERMDVSQTPMLFWPDSAIFENGGVEGTFAYDLEHHLGPEFDDLAGFDFGDHAMKVEIDGDTALVSETYTYHITFTDGAREAIERRGVATSVLRQRDDEWRFVRYHSSARPLRGAS